MKTKKKKINYKDLEYKYNLLSDLMEHIPDVIYFKDKKGKLIMVNHAHARGLGLKPEQVVGKTDFDFFPKDRAELMAKDDIRVIKTGKPIIDKVERATRPDGIDNYSSTTKIPRYDSKGNIIGLVGITRDITHRAHVKSLQEEKERIQKKLNALEEVTNMKSEFVSVVSHELRTPLAIIKEAVLLLFEQLVGPINPKQKEILSKAKNNVERLKNIVDELLDISRIERGTLNLHYSLLNLNDLLRDSSDFFRKLAQEKGIRLEYALPREQVNIFVDAGRINQIVSNLISNAIKFTEENGEIRIEAKILEAKVRIGVMDTGIGIAKHDLPNLFKKFVQASKSESAERKGVGLGLAIVKELVGKHGGEIWAESRLGVGTKLYFTLPLFYTEKSLNKDIRDTVNNLLQKGSSVYLINLLIVNFKEFKKRTRIKPRRLFEDLKIIIDGSLERFHKKGKNSPQVILEDYRSGEWGILIAETEKDRVAEICGLLRDRMREYFTKNKLKDVFINLGILSYSSDEQGVLDKQLLANIHINKIYIGSEVRRFKRVSYKANIEVVHSEDKTESSQTMDISEGGVCFLSERQLVTDAPVRMRLGLSMSKKPLDIKARVAWQRSTKEEGSKEGAGRYKIGLQFVGLKGKDKSRVSRLIKSLA
ncbi:MAG: PAS domain-containing protein [Candidatus Omnitrophica bacterium]|nr:PAS domain-containing protein [Candidatus Omnitrophota bacterium]